MTRWLRRLATLVVLLLGALIAGAALLIVLVTQTDAGRERMRQLVLRIVAGKVQGSTYLGALHIAPPCSVHIDSLVLRDPRGVLLAATGSVQARCDLGSLLRGDIVLTMLHVQHPNAVVRHEADGTWNWAHAFRRGPPRSSSGGGRAVVINDLALQDATILLEMPWEPPDSLSGARRDSAIAFNLRREDVEIRRASDGYVQRRHWTRLALDAPTLRIGGAGDTTVAIQLARFSARGSDPPLDIRDMRGWIHVRADDMGIDLPRLALAGSTCSVSGRISWAEPGPIRLDLRASADPFALADVAWVLPGLPSEGGGRAHLDVRSEADARITDYVIRDLDIRTGDSHLRGNATVGAGGPVLIVKDVALTFEPLSVGLLRDLTRGGLPHTIRGELRGRMLARGGPLDRFRIDSADITFRDAALRGAKSRVAVRGGLNVLVPAKTRFRQFTLAMQSVDVRTLARLVPRAPRLRGTLLGRATLDSAWNDVRISDADLTYRRGTAEPLRVRGGGRVTFGKVMRFDVALRATPLSFAALAPLVPTVAGIPSVVGDVRASGTVNDVRLITQLGGRGGDIAFDGRVRTKPLPTIQGTGRIRKLDLSTALGRRALPRSDLDVDVDVDVTGDSLATMQGQLSAAIPRGSVGTLALHPSRASLRFADGRVHADTLLLKTSAGAVRASGALGLTRAVRDTLAVQASSDSLGTLMRLATRSDTAPPKARRASVMDSLSGSLALGARLVGSIDSLDVTGSADGNALRLGHSTVRRAHLALALSDLPAALRGRAELRVDSISVGTVHLPRIDASAQAATARQWRVAMQSDEHNSLGGAVLGTVELDSAATTVGLDSLVLRSAGEMIQLTRPARVRIAGSAMTADTIELRGSRGAQLRFGGTYADSGAIDVELSATSIPLTLRTDTTHAPSAQQDTVVAAPVVAHADVDAHLTGTSAAPRLTARSAIRVTHRTRFPLDSMSVTATYTRGKGTLALLATGGGRRLLDADATVPIDFALSPKRLALLDAPVKGRIVLDRTPLPDLLALVPAVRATAGVASADIAIEGTGRHPRFAGAAGLSGGEVAVPATGTRLQAITADVRFTGDSIVLRKVSAVGAGARAGRAALDGVLRLANVRDPSFDLHLRLAGMTVLATQQFRDLAVTSELRLRGVRSASTLSGAVTVDRGVVRIPDIGARAVANESDPEFVRLLDSITNRRPTSRSSFTTAFVRHLRLNDVKVQMGPEVWLRSAEVNVNLGGAIEVTHAGQAPSADTGAGMLALRGALDIRRGTFRLDLGVVQRTFTLEEGSLEFRGEPEMNPHLDLSALYVVAGAQGRQQDARIRVRLGGTLQQPTLTLSDAGTSSGATLTEDQLFSYLVTGQSSVDVGSGETYRNLVGTEVASRLATAAADKLTGGFFDVVNVSTGSVETNTRDIGQTSGSALAGSRLGLGKQISEKTFLTLNAGMCSLNAPGGFDVAQFSESIGISIERRIRPDFGLTLSSEPATSALYCAQGTVSRGAAPAPRQMGFDVLKKWRF